MGEIGAIGKDFLQPRRKTTSAYRTKKQSGVSRRTVITAVGGAAAASALMGTGAVLQRGVSALAAQRSEPSHVPSVSESQVPQPEVLESIPHNEVFGHLKGKDLETFEFLSAREIKEYRNPLYIPAIPNRSLPASGDRL